jgi:hypothetical protein
VSDALHRVAMRIRDELSELMQVVERTQVAWRRAQESFDDLYLDSVALNLHALYTGLERVFELIAGTIDGHVPQGSNWHQLLLEQMSHELPGVRPPVISEATRVKLDNYRGFRHLVRNVYSFRFDPSKMQMLVEEAPQVFNRTRDELSAFARFLESSGSKR